jgi:hypothetical protein
MISKILEIGNLYRTYAQIFWMKQSGESTRICKSTKSTSTRNLKKSDGGITHKEPT